jgi:hypothetical protein
MSKQPAISSNTIERDIVINGTRIHIKSVFADKTSLEKALTNIARRKLAKLEK